MGNYIDFLKEGVETEFNVFVRQVPYSNMKVFRINSGTFNLEPWDVPNTFYEYKNHYIFIFNLDSDPSENAEVLSRLGLFDKNKKFSEEDYDEWILIICDNEKYTLIKDSWYRSLDSIQLLNEFKCQD